MFMPQVTSWVLDRATVVLSAVGVYISGVLTAAHMMHTVLPCAASSGCDVVAADSSSYIGAVPISAVGLGIYTMLMILGVIRLLGYVSARSVMAGLALTFVGLVVSAWLTWHAKVDLGAVCLWCAASGGTMLLLFLVHLWLRFVPWHAHILGTGDIALPAVVLIALPGVMFWTMNGAKPPITHVDGSRLNSVQVADLAPPNAHSLGKANTAVTIVEFADLTCPACRVMHARLMKLMTRGFNLRLVFRHLPLSYLPGHALATYAAQLAESAPSEESFWQFVTRVYSSDKVSRSSLVADANLVLGASEISKDAQLKVARDLDFAVSLGMSQTPTYVIMTPNGARIPSTSTDLADRMNEPQVVRWLTVH